MVSGWKISPRDAEKNYFCGRFW